MIHEACEALVDILVAADVRATMDPRRVDPPCVLVTADAGEFSSMCVGDANTRFVLHVLAPQPGTSDAFRQLSQLVGQTVAAIPRIESVQLASYSTSQGAEWPSYQLSFAMETSWI